MNHLVWALAFSVLLLSACGLKDDAEKMKDSTERIRENSEDMKRDSSEIKANTERMNSTSDVIQKYSRHLAKRTDDLENELTNKESYAMTLANLDYLFGKGEIQRGQEAHLSVDSDLLLFASAAMQSMYFQYWKGDFNEGIEVLDRRIELAADILFTRAVKHIPRDFQVDSLNPNRSFKAIASLGARMQDVRPEFTEHLVRAGLEPFSFYDLVITALENRNQTSRSERLPRSIAKILHWKQEAIYMLQLRHNYLPMVVVGRMTDIMERNIIGKFWMLWFKQNVDLHLYDVEQLREWTKWLRQALQTRLHLREVGIEPEYNWSIHKILQRIDFNQAKILANSTALLNGKDFEKKQFAEAFEAIKADYDRGNRSGPGQGHKIRKD